MKENKLADMSMSFSIKRFLFIYVVSGCVSQNQQFISAADDLKNRAAYHLSVFTSLLYHLRALIQRKRYRKVPFSLALQ